MPATCQPCGLTFEDAVALVQHVNDVHHDEEGS
jgi:uncharacterized C2H2 Zn-finger protein